MYSKHYGQHDQYLSTLGLEDSCIRAHYLKDKFQLMDVTYVNVLEVLKQGNMAINVRITEN